MKMQVMGKIKSQLSNILTLVRILIVPPFIMLLFKRSIISGYISLVLFIIAAISDYFDGRIARKCNIRTAFGEFMDPLADKILVGGAFIAFSLLPDFFIPAWLIGLILLREILLTVLRAIALRKKNPIVTEFSGKIKTAFQMFTILCLLILLVIKKILLFKYPELLEAENILFWKALFGTSWGTIFHFFPLVLVSLSAALAIYSLFDYVQKNYKKTGFQFFIKLLASGGYIGYIPIARGTFGALMGTLIWVLLSRSVYYYLVTLIIVISGFFISDYAEKYIFLKKDSSKIVIDEIAGVLITFLSFQFKLVISGISYLVLGFILFRFFDIVKPSPIKNMQKVRGGAGIMLDDVISGVIANAVLQVLRILLFSF